MRHQKADDRFGRFSSWRKATVNSLVRAVLLNEHIMTTEAKARVARRAVDKIITLGKKNTLFAKRQAFRILCDHGLVKLLFDAIAPKFANINGGYTRVIPFKKRRGDNALVVMLALTQTYKEKKIKEKPKADAKEAKVSKKKEADVQEAPKQPEASVQPHEAKPHAEPKSHKEHKEKEMPKPTDKPKKIFGGFKGIFKKQAGKHDGSTGK